MALRYRDAPRGHIEEPGAVRFGRGCRRGCISEDEAAAGISLMRGGAARHLIATLWSSWSWE